MRSLLCVLFLVIFCSVQMTSSAPISSNVSECCFVFSKLKIPIRQVKSYHRTSSVCPKQAIVFHTVSGKRFCVDPETTWVSGHVDKVDKRTTTATKTMATESSAAASITPTTAKIQTLTV